MSLHRQIDWNLTRLQSGISIGRIFNYSTFPVGHSRDVIGLLSGSMRQEYPKGETPKQANTFISKFMEAKGDFPKSEFQALGWVHTSDKGCWARMVGFVLESWGAIGIIQLLPRSQGRTIHCPFEPLPFLRDARAVQSGLLHILYLKWRDRVCIARNVWSLRPADGGFAIWRIHSRHKRTSNEEGCPAGLWNLLGSVMSLPYVRPDHQTESRRNKADVLGQLIISGFGKQNRPSIPMSRQYWWRDWG